MAPDALDTGFAIRLGGTTILSHAAGAPCIAVGRGHAHVAARRGHFDVSQSDVERIALTHAEADGDRIRLAEHAGGPWLLELAVSIIGDDAVIVPKALDPTLNRLWLRVPAEADEHIWGGGEQFSYFDLRGRHFPLWSSEPGVGRDPESALFQQVEALAKGGGGSYAHTNYPQPTFISSRRYALHIDSYAYAAFDFRDAAFHEVEVWEIPARIELWARPRFAGIVAALADRFGKQPPLPEWLYKGAVIGLKDGAESFTRLKRYEEAGVAVSGLWCEDWVGLRITSFGNRLFWDWKWNAERYPDLPGHIAELRERGIRFLGYVNPYLAVDGELYAHAAEHGYLVMRPDADEPYVIDFGEFDCGHVDFTNPAAAEWFAEAVIGRNMLDFGLSGWMADFGEYLPVDVRLANGESGMTAHNRWPALWGEVNAKGVAGRGRTGDVMFFMRSGAAGVQKHCPMLWAGDQAVDFSRHDGIGTVICAALSAGLLGNAHHHSDTGGYTSLFDTTRSPELAMRWAEMAAFTSMIRTHEGNRPRANTQYDDSPELLAHFARMTRIYAHLAPYLRTVSHEAADTGLPIQRPLFLHFEDDPKTYAIQTAYLLGPDLLVAPVIEQGRQDWTTYLPAGTRWVHVWSGEQHEGGRDVTVPAPFGQPPVFYRAGAAEADLFGTLAAL
ncbi:alpha-glucosidase [Novosphingobium sp. EMRT-2]|uniref:alpha-glucosidase n=1 Tax=Novosphingobium sp. EMRT-2 TaxID=2571749 RepID=UPI0010BD2313|nr:alpha-glucosidase [Novosphingobium sp. EMRT-2]QCI95718.1 alpha-glucosidase [Novosphingobium sp. EMRT-2]